MRKFRKSLFGLSLMVCAVAASAPSHAQSIRSFPGASTNSTTPASTTTNSTTGATTPTTPTRPTVKAPTSVPLGNAQAASGGGNHNTSFAPMGDSCQSGAPSLPIWNAGDVADNVKAMSKATKYYLENCRCPDTSCVADALDNYAAALEALGPRLPPAVADLPAIVRRAAHKVRAARSISQARAAIGEAEHVIRAKLQLLEVADPDARSDSIRSARFTGDLLSVADVSLVRVAGL